jgi:HlyD family secretion protein
VLFCARFPDLNGKGSGKHLFSRGGRQGFARWKTVGFQEVLVREAAQNVAKLIFCARLFLQRAALRIFERYTYYMKKYLPLVPVVAVAIIAGTLFVRSQRVAYATATVMRDSVTQEVLASGNVAAQSTITLQFQTGGTLRAVHVATGDRVSRGDVLAQLDSSVLRAQLSQAQAAVQTQEAQLRTLTEGTRPEQIAITDAQISGDKNAVAQANRALINAIQSAYTQADDAINNKSDSIFSNPHTTNPQLSIAVSNSQLASTLSGERVAMEAMLGAWAKSFPQLTASGDLASAEFEAEANMAMVSRYLSDVNTLLASAIPNQQTNQTSISALITNVATARANINTANASLTSAFAAQQSATALLDKDQKTLALQNAGSTQSTIDTQRALVAQAEANVAAIQAQIAQMAITAPVDGTVTAVNGDVGETISPQAAMVLMIPNTKLQIDVNLSEDNVATVHTGDPVRITLDAFPGQERIGTVTSVDPAQTIVGGAVYYKTTVVLQGDDSDVKPGMTANVWIQTGAAANVLVIPASALSNRSTQSSVQVLENGTPRTRTVTTGLRGQDGMVEIIAGLSEGELVVTASE